MIWPWILGGVLLLALLVWGIVRMARRGPQADARSRALALARSGFSRIEKLGLLAAGERGRYVALHIDVLPPVEGLRGGAPLDLIVLQPSLPAGDTRARVVLYQDESGGLSWHFAEDAFLTPEQRQRLLQRGLRTPLPNRFVIRARTGEARATLVNGVPRRSLRGPAW